MTGVRWRKFGSGRQRTTRIFSIRHWRHLWNLKSYHHSKVSYVLTPLVSHPFSQSFNPVAGTKDNVSTYLLRVDDSGWPVLNLVTFCDCGFVIDLLDIHPFIIYFGPGASFCNILLLLLKRKFLLKREAVFQIANI